MPDVVKNINAPVTEIPIYEKSYSEQKNIKPPIEGACEYFLTDENLKNGSSRLLEILREMKIKPRWVSKNTYDYFYKRKKIATLRFRTKNNICISVTIADKDDLEKIILSQPDDLINEFANRTISHCITCSPSCKFGVKFFIAGKERNFCSRFNYMRVNPTAEQFGIIEKYIDISKKYNDGKK